MPCVALHISSVRGNFSHSSTELNFLLKIFFTWKKIVYWILGGHWWEVWKFKCIENKIISHTTEKQSWREWIKCSTILTMSSCYMSFALTIIINNSPSCDHFGCHGTLNFGAGDLTCKNHSLNQKSWLPNGDWAKNLTWRVV